MKSLFEYLDNLLPQMKQKLLSEAEDAQMIIGYILSVLENASEFERAVFVGKLVNSDMISTVCEVMQTSDETFVNIVLDCFMFASTHKEFYENHAAVTAVKSMARLAYCVNKSFKDSRLLRKLVQSICNVLVRSSELAVDLNDVCDSQQIMLLVNNLNVHDLWIKLTVMTMLNVVLLRGIFNEDADEEIIIDVCRTAISSMTRIVKYSKDDNAILLAAVILCGTCAGGSRFCCASFEQEGQIGNSTIQQKKTELLDAIYNAMMTIIIPYAKDTNLSRIDPASLHRNLVFCLNNLYQLKSCNHDDLSNHLAASGYLKYFLRLTVQPPENLRKSICILLSRILRVLGKTAFSRDADKFGDVLRVGLLELPNDSADQWNNAIARKGKAGAALAILLYYHLHGTQENDIVSPQSLIARVMLVQPSKAIPLTILKPLWFLFAVTSISHPCPSSMHHYESAAAQLARILHENGSEIGEFYTHHVDLLQHCLVCPEYSQRVLNKVLDLWLIESDGDIKPLLPLFNCGKVVRRLLVVLYANSQPRIMSLAAKALRHLIEIGDRYVDHIADIVWYMLPNILLSCELYTVAYTEVLELTNITRPHIMPIHHIEHCADIIVNIILKETTNLKFMTSIVKQAYIFLRATVSRKSFKVLKIYIKNAELLKNLYVYGFSKERSELSSVSVKLLAFVVNCQRKSSIKCEQPLIVRVKALVELLMHTAKSPCCAINGLQLICELLTQNADGSAVVLQKIAADADDTDMLINLYEFLHMAHVQENPVQRDVVYRCLGALLDFCDFKVPELIPHLCTVMSNYGLFLDVVNTRHASCHFVKYAAVWLRYRRTSCNDVPWNSRSLYKTPFDEVLDQLREYSAIFKKKGLRQAYLLRNLQRALSQYPSEQ